MRKIVVYSNRGGNDMGSMEFSLNRKGCLDSSKIRSDTNEYVSVGKRLIDELGKKFETDKATIELAIDSIENDNKSYEEKKKILNGLRKMLEDLQKQYEREVTEEEYKVQEKIREQLEIMQEVAEEFIQNADSIKNMKLEVVSASTDDSVRAAEEKKKEFEAMHKEYVDKLNLQIERAKMQQRNILARRLSGR